MFTKIPRMIFFIFCSLTIIGIAIASFTGKIDFSSNWRTASRASAGLAPKPEDYREAVVQAYAARTYNWRGIFAVHTWLAMKDKDAKSYTVYQVIGWNVFLGLPVLSIKEDVPDRRWFGNMPRLLLDLRGKDAENAIVEVKRLALQYPYQTNYNFWPGPNSNTFTAYIARNIPALHLALPPLAIGKDYLSGFKFWAKAPSNTGYQLSFYGILGLMVAKEEGFELNILSLVFGVNPKAGALILPSIGNIYIRK